MYFVRYVSITDIKSQEYFKIYICLVVYSFCFSLALLFERKYAYCQYDFHRSGFSFISGVYSVKTG